MSKFEILSVSTKKKVFIRLWIVEARDLETTWRVTGYFDRLPSEQTIIEGLEHELLQLKKADTFWKLPGKVIEN